MHKPCYVLFPGYVISKSNRDSHYISAFELAHLYGLDYKKCRIIHRDSNSCRDYRKRIGDIHLYPDYSGDYTLPKLESTNEQ